MRWEKKRRKNRKERRKKGNEEECQRGKEERMRKRVFNEKESDLPTTKRFKIKIQ